MVFTSRVQSTFFGQNSTSSVQLTSLIRLPLSVAPHYETRCPVSGIVMPVANKKLQRANLWSSDEHERFLRGLELFPNGPWKEIAKIVGTKTTRQTMTHAQKYRQKIERHSLMGGGKYCVHNVHSDTTATAKPLPRETGYYASIGETSYSTTQPVAQDVVASPCDTSTEELDGPNFDREYQSLISSLDPRVVAPSKLEEDQSVRGYTSGMHAGSHRHDHVEEYLLHFSEPRVSSIQQRRIEPASVYHGGPVFFPAVE